MTVEEIKHIQEIQGTAGFRLIEFLLNSRIKELDKVSEIDFDKPNIEAKCIGRALAVKWCKEILSEINLSSPNKATNRTYE